MYIYVLYVMLVIILSMCIKFNPLLAESNFYFIYPFFSIFICLVINVFFKKIKVFLIVNSLLYYILSLIFYLVNFSVNEFGFFGNFDDSYFYNQGLKFLSSDYIFDGPFDIIVSAVLYFGANDALSAVVVNWFLSTILLGLIYKFSLEVNNNFKISYLYVISLNYYFIEASILLFRDILGLIFLILSFIFILRKKVIFNFFAFLSILVRPMTGTLAYVFFILNRSKWVNNNYKWKYFLFLFLFLCFYLIYSYIPIGFISRGGFEGDLSAHSLQGLNKERLEMVSKSESDITSKLISLGPIGMPFVMVLNVFTPLRFMDYFSDIEYIYLENGRYTINYVNNFLNYKGILSTLHIFVLAFWLVPFLNGFFNFLKMNKKDILILFLFILFLVSFISFQPRHKLHFLIFLPLICSYTKLNVKNIILCGVVIEFMIYVIFFKWFIWG